MLRKTCPSDIISERFSVITAPIIKCKKENKTSQGSTL